ncbi:MAG TPA: response regulator, partial [Chitinophagaceae bacterium]|nr:response regulator [Chitinophagaceae bacterium]
RLEPGINLLKKPYQFQDLALRIKGALSKFNNQSRNEEAVVTPSATEPALQTTLFKNTILIVEDNADGRIALKDLLELLGYMVLDAGSAEAALPMLDENIILLTDVNLPGMSGIELAKTARTRYPNMPVIFSSGAIVSSTEGLGSDVMFLPKPYTLEGLQKLIKQATEMNVS